MTQLNVHSFLFSIVFLIASPSFAGAGFICDNYGNSCIQPGGNCQNLIPPTYICEFEPLSSSPASFEPDEDQATLKPYAAACCSWGDNIPQCMPGC